MIPGGQGAHYGHEGGRPEADPLRPPELLPLQQHGRVFSTSAILHESAVVCPSPNGKDQASSSLLSLEKTKNDYQYQSQSEMFKFTAV